MSKYYSGFLKDSSSDNEQVFFTTSKWWTMFRRFWLYQQPLWWVCVWCLWWGCWLWWGAILHVEVRTKGFPKWIVTFSLFCCPISAFCFTEGAKNTAVFILSILIKSQSHSTCFAQSRPVLFFPTKIFFRINKSQYQHLYKFPSLNASWFGHL